MNIAANFWKTMRTARINQLTYCGTEPKLAEAAAHSEINIRKQLSERHEPWAGILAVLDVEKDENGVTRWVVRLDNFRIE
jgi:hypothetical protein